jgi:hypothetical protein
MEVNITTMYLCDFSFHFDLVEEVLVVRELCLFRRLFVISTACVNPFVWWRIQEIQFPNVIFLAKRILGI